VAAHFGTDHHERILDEQTMLDRLPGIIANMDEPFADSSISPTSLVSEFARTRVTVALGGDGGDELFAGYNTFRLDQLAAHYARLPRLIRRSMIEPAMAAAGALSGHRRIGRGGEYVGDAADTPESWRVMLWSEAVVKPPFMRAVLTADALGPQSLYDDTIRLYEQAPRRSRLARVQYQYQHQYLPEDILTKVDRASMMHSLEVRAPFLDPRVVDFANALPDCLKLRGSAGKWFLKQVFRRRLPAEILFRRKMGFGIPMDQWLRSGLRVHFERLCSTEALRNQGIFRPEPLEQLWQQHLSGRRDCGGLLWTFLAFQLWWERHRPVTAHAQ
jgi:asparagine synthase (glutamine-hydrolysing)